MLSPPGRETAIHSVNSHDFIRADFLWRHIYRFLLRYRYTPGQGKSNRSKTITTSTTQFSKRRVLPHTRLTNGKFCPSDDWSSTYFIPYTGLGTHRSGVRQYPLHSSPLRVMYVPRDFWQTVTANYSSLLWMLSIHTTLTWLHTSRSDGKSVLIVHANVDSVRIMQTEGS